MRTSIAWVLAVLNRGLFGHEVTPAMVNFLRRLSWSFLGTALGAASFFIVNVLAGRILGPEEYGRYSLVVAAASAFAVLVGVGLDTTLVKYVAASSTEDESSRIVAVALRVVGVSAAAFIAVGGLARTSIATLLGTDTNLILCAVLYAVLLCYKSTLDAVIRGRQEFAFQAKVKLAEAMIVFASFGLIVIVLTHRSYVHYLLAVALGAMLVVATYRVSLIRHVGRWDWATLRSLLPYAGPSWGTSAIAVVIASSDRVVVNRFVSTADLGVYSAYLLSTTMLCWQVSMSIGNVLFPQASKLDDKIGLVRKVDRLAMLLFVPFMVVMSLISYVIILSFGARYPVIWRYIVLSCGAAFAQLLAVLYGSVAMSSVKLFRSLAKAIYVKPLFIGGIYYGLYLNTAICLTTVWIALIASALYDATASRVVAARNAIE